MKKTLIALTVAASAAVSGSAMAWNPAGLGGNGGTFSMSGTLSKAEKTVPWAVEIGAPVTALDVTVKPDQKNVFILLEKDIPILGIHSGPTGFIGDKGIAPQIDYNNTTDVNYMDKGNLPAQLDVTSSDGKKIGTLAFVMRVACQASEKKGEGDDKLDSSMLFASSKGKAFFGGVAKDEKGVWSDAAAYTWATHLFSSIADSWDTKIPYTAGDADETDFSNGNSIYRGYYASGLAKGIPMELVLDQTITSATPVPWKASLPIVISYM
ncbi:cshE pilin [Escherichia coli O124]|uniref:F4 family fimbrial subunit n=1 Tax=Escherichia coli TaxID=562 RepID=UPI00093E81D5|nr:cshE pilin [Escherichia coli]EHD3379136.1 cshE pilin [Escherichia coli O124]EHD3410717.1 cshE pilin [Escherichia coli O152]HBD0245363.1 cshE pilin [Escherichia coli]